ncbi:carbon storage regulator [bacterium]|nr:carbon storage regulator [bacterium]
MLVLTRKIGESIIIQTSTGEEIEIVLLSTKGNQAQIGTEAADDISVHREEVLERMRCGV